MVPKASSGTPSLEDGIAPQELKVELMPQVVRQDDDLSQQ
jgi:hypothetical protein